MPLVVLTTHLPRRRSQGDAALRAAGPGTLYDVVDLLSDEAFDRLARYAKGGRTGDPQTGFWTADDLSRRLW
jgi:hypothetical protein